MLSTDAWEFEKLTEWCRNKPEDAAIMIQLQKADHDALVNAIRAHGNADVIDKAASQGDEGRATPQA